MQRGSLCWPIMGIVGVNGYASAMQNANLPLELTMPSNGCENVMWTSMWSLAHMTSSETIFGIPFGLSVGHNSFAAETKLNCNGRKNEIVKWWTLGWCIPQFIWYEEIINWLHEDFIFCWWELYWDQVELFNICSFKKQFWLRKKVPRIKFQTKSFDIHCVRDETDKPIPGFMTEWDEDLFYWINKTVSGNLTRIDFNRTAIE